jgi:hypothetical protein
MMMRALSTVVFVATLSMSSAWALPNETSEIPTAFAIAKSSNKNQVDYAVSVDGSCNPATQTPVRPYWRMFERSKDTTEPLSSFEERAFGIAHQDVRGDSVSFALRGLPSRTITIRTQRTPNGCGASTTMSIAGALARVSSVWVKQSLFGVSYVELTGVDGNGKSVSEIVKP